MAPAIAGTIRIAGATKSRTSMTHAVTLVYEVLTSDRQGPNASAEREARSEIHKGPCSRCSGQNEHCSFLHFPKLFLENTAVRLLLSSRK